MSLLSVLLLVCIVSVEANQEITISNATILSQYGAHSKFSDDSTQIAIYTASTDYFNIYLYKDFDGSCEIKDRLKFLSNIVWQQTNIKPSDCCFNDNCRSSDNCGTYNNDDLDNSYGYCIMISPMNSTNISIVYSIEWTTWMSVGCLLLIVFVSIIVFGSIIGGLCIILLFYWSCIKEYCWSCCEKCWSCCEKCFDWLKGIYQACCCKDNEQYNSLEGGTYQNTKVIFAEPTAPSL